jgi:hypothetical protein
VIWRLPHPFRGLAAFSAVFALGLLLGSLLDRFGMGLPELAALALLGGGAGWIAATRTSGDRGTSA